MHVLTRLPGFTVFDYYDKAPAVYKQIVQWINSGKYNADGEMIVKTGIEGVPATWNSLFSGANKGKLITQLQV